MIFTTAFSVYELDTEQGRIRLVSTTHDHPTPNQRDGDWRQFDYMDPVEVGKRPMIVWGVEGPREDEAMQGISLVLRRTHLSMVTAINP